MKKYARKTLTLLFMLVCLLVIFQNGNLKAEARDNINLERKKIKTVSGLSTAEEKTIWSAHKEGVMSRHIWAPEMHLINKKWYIFFAAGNSDDKWHIRPYVLRCNGADPYNDIWEELGKITAEQHRVLVSHPDIPERIHSALGKNDGYWESYWETVSEVAHTIANEYMAQNTHSTAESADKNE